MPSAPESIPPPIRFPAPSRSPGSGIMPAPTGPPGGQDGLPVRGGAPRRLGSFRVDAPGPRQPMACVPPTSMGANRFPRWLRRADRERNARTRPLGQDGFRQGRQLAVFYERALTLLGTAINVGNVAAILAAGAVSVLGIPEFNGMISPRKELPHGGPRPVA